MISFIYFCYFKVKVDSLNFLLVFMEKRGFKTVQGEKEIRLPLV